MTFDEKIKRSNEEDKNNEDYIFCWYVVNPIVRVFLKLWVYEKCIKSNLMFY